MPPIKHHLSRIYRTNTDEKSRQGFLRLDMNESLSGLPKKFINDVFSRVSPDYLATYPEYRSLKEKIAQFNNVLPENILLANGSDAAIKYIFDVYIKEGDKVLLTDPTFAMYPVYGQIFNAQAVLVEYNHDLSFPKNKFLKMMNSDVKMAVIVNPNNPTGSVISPQDLQEIITLAADKDILLIIDEAYFPFCPYTVVEQVKHFSHLIVLRTFSKMLAMAGARLGYAVACPSVIESLGRVRPTYDVNGLAVLLAESLLSKKEIINELMEDFKQGRDFLQKQLSKYHIPYKDTNANFVLISCGDRLPGIKAALEENKILVGGPFKQSFLEGYIRVTAGPKPVMEKFLESFIKIWQRSTLASRQSNSLANENSSHL